MQYSPFYNFKTTALFKRAVYSPLHLLRRCLLRTLSQIQLYKQSNCFIDFNGSFTYIATAPIIDAIPDSVVFQFFHFLFIIIIIKTITIALSADVISDFHINFVKFLNT
jgi:hypothetical protein